MTDVDAKFEYVKPPHASALDFPVAIRVDKAYETCRMDVFVVRNELTRVRCRWRRILHTETNTFTVHHANALDH